MWGWHLDALCAYLQALARSSAGGIQRLLVNIPPRHGKSNLCCVFYPAWLWALKPDMKMMFASYSQTISTRDSVETRRLIESPWYRDRWGSVYSLLADQNEKMRFENNKKGLRLATSVGGANTGEGGHLIACDDPHNVKESESDVQRQTAIDWWFGTMSTRANNPKTGRWLVIGQRTHEQDLSAAILERGDYEHLNLAARYEPKFAKPLRYGRQDPRTQDGEPLWPSQYGDPELKVIERALGSARASAQLQQRPTPAEGGFFKRAWWKFYKIDPRLQAESADDACWSWDCAFKALDDSDYVVGQAWVRKGANFYLLVQVRDRMSYTATKNAVKSTAFAWPNITYRLIEDKANGTAVIDDLTADVPGLVAVEPKGGKESRAASIQALVEGGNVWLPDPSIAPWVEAYIEELASFPKGANDDQVDSTSQALVWLQERFNKRTGFSVTSFTKSYTQRQGVEKFRDPRYE